MMGEVNLTFFYVYEIVQFEQKCKENRFDEK